MTEVDLAEDDGDDIELTDLNSIVEPRTRFTDFVLEEGMITLDPKERGRHNNKQETMIANSITEYGDSELLVD